MRDLFSARDPPLQARITGCSNLCLEGCSRDSVLACFEDEWSNFLWIGSRGRCDEGGGGGGGGGRRVGINGSLK